MQRTLIVDGTIILLPQLTVRQSERKTAPSGTQNGILIRRSGVIGLAMRSCTGEAEAARPTDR